MKSVFRAQKMKLKFLTLFFTLLTMTNVAYSISSFNLELGSAQNSYNQVKIDGENGTMFNLRPALNSSDYYRISFIQKFKSSNGIRFLYAPLKFSGEKNFNKDIYFNGELFPSNQKTEAQFQFNSYRATYFREIISQKNFLLRVGGTIKVRDAFIELKQSDRTKARKSIGIVPLFYAYSKYKFENNFLLTLDFDGLVAPQGRALDVGLMFGYYFNPTLQIDVGYRMLEGGADNEKVYNFSQINYLFTAVQLNF
jgi:hypothetical protein